MGGWLEWRGNCDEALRLGGEGVGFAWGNGGCVELRGAVGGLVDWWVDFD